jgi:hypothetical protein
MIDYAALAAKSPRMKRGKVWCRICGSTQKIDSALCLRDGWPECCGETMTMDSPEEQAAAEGKRGAA